MHHGHDEHFSEPRTSLQPSGSKTRKFWYLEKLWVGVAFEIVLRSSVTWFPLFYNLDRIYNRIYNRSHTATESWNFVVQSKILRKFAQCISLSDSDSARKYRPLVAFLNFQSLKLQEEKLWLWNFVKSAETSRQGGAEITYIIIRNF